MHDLNDRNVLRMTAPPGVGSAPADQTVDNPVFWAPSTAFLKFAIVCMLAGAVVYEIALFAYAPDQMSRALAGLLQMLVAGAAGILLYRGRTNAAVRTLGIGVWAYITCISFFLGGVGSTLIIVYPLTILLIGWLIGTRTAAVVAFLTVAVTLVFALCEWWGILPAPPPTPPMMRWIVQCFVFILSAALIHQVVRSYRNRLDDVHQLGRELARRTAELQSRESDLNRAQAVANVGSWAYDLESDRMVLSAETCRIFGVPEGATGNHVLYLAHIHPADRKRVARAWRAALKGGTLFDNEHRIRGGGAVRWVRQRAEFEFDANGRPVRSLGTTQDITERKQAETIRDALAAIADNSNDAIVSRDRDNRIIYWNRAAERMFGYAANEVLGQNVALIVPPDREEEVRQSRNMHEKRGTVVDLETVRLAKGGRRIDVSVTVSPIRDEQLRLISVALIFRDISERKRKAALMQLLESLARATNEAATPEAAVRACLEQICIYGNWPLGHVALYAPGQSAGAAPAAFWRCDDPARFEEFMRYSDQYNSNRPEGKFVGVAIREKRPVWIEEVSNVPGRGRLREAERYGIRSGFVFPVFVGGEIAGFIEFFDTMTRLPDEMLLDAIDSVASQLSRLIERSRAGAELEMRVASRTAALEAANRELDSFSYTIAHDMRAPVRAINGFSELVLKANEGKLDETTLGYLKRVVAGSRRMGELIDDLLNLARLSRQEMRRQDCDLSEMAAGIVAALADSQPERAVSVAILPDMRINGDPGLMRAALDNLIGNAWKFTAKTAAARIEVGATQARGQTACFVRDNGAGFDMQYAHKLFAPFQRLHHTDEFEGTGIGLATVWKIIERHNGRIWIESAVDQGTTVFFTVGSPA